MGFGDGIVELTIGTSSWPEDPPTRRVSVKDVFSRICSKRASPSVVVLCVNDPPVVLSSCRADSLISPNQKC